MNLLERIAAFYEADGGNAGGGSQSNTNNDGNGEGNQTVTEPNNSGEKDPIPYDRFKSVVEQKNDFKTKYEELIQQQEKAQQEAKEKQGEFESLYNDLKTKHDPLSQELSQYKETFQEVLKNKLETVPENMRDLIPQGNEVDQLKWIENATAKGLFKQDNPQSFGNGGSNPDSSTSNTKGKKGFLREISRFN